MRGIATLAVSAGISAGGMQHVMRIKTLRVTTKNNVKFIEINGEKEMKIMDERRFNR